jgi:carnitine 3-dehydrogenase
MDIKRVSCVGAGLIGKGWATVFSSKGLEVTLQDIDERILENALKDVASTLMFLETRNLIGKGEAKGALERIKTTTHIAKAVEHADYVQESVPDNYEIKKKVFKEMDESAHAHAILASSASGLMMTEIQPVTTRPERCVLVHPILPVHLIPVVEIAGGQKTDPETVKAARDFMKALGKTPVVLNREVSGYVVNRLQAALLREAVDLVDKGVVSAEDLDKAFCMGIGLRDPIIGPLLRVHLAGGGVEKFFQNYSESYRYRWESMETWTSIPPSAAKAVVKSVNEMELVRKKSLKEVQGWRDEMLVKILKAVHGDQER